MLKSYDHFTQWPEDEWPWANFSPREMASKREGELKLNTRAMDMLQQLRNQLGRPLIVVSAYRSPEHNRAVGGAKHSKHMLGEAFDIRMDNHDPIRFEEAARAVGFQGFGFYPASGFMHIDMGPRREWGTRWKQTATNLPNENTRKPPVKAATGAVASAATAVAIENVPAATQLLGDLAPVAQTAAVLAIIAFAAYLLWRGWH
ncbi:YcbK family protein [Roseovarius indicus]|uniref:Murein endopeptidase K n=1 Tax=Roseovarius indicus TaxID=540747 RepID=A0A5P3AGV2_9RHOB|nr:D-Ala-D-Ala carboxypeptidase family metallohydrolase [Roseovarius indicus]QEW27820.1 Peptidase M15 [Roseovarius indicus]SFE79909.1 Peptidase M15 [Roseovarius indicus]